MGRSTSITQLECLRESTIAHPSVDDDGLARVHVLHGGDAIRRGDDRLSASVEHLQLIAEVLAVPGVSNRAARAVSLVARTDHDGVR